MSTKPRIKKLNSLKQAAVFHDFSAPAELPDFLQHNLIYGFNGCGKTTLSRIFSSLQTGTQHSKLPAASFRFTLDNGSSLNSTATFDDLTGRVFVYNEDFRTEQFGWAEGEAQPIAYISKTQKDISEQITAATKELASMKTEVAAASKDKNATTTAFDKFKTNTARDIAEKAGLPARNYMAPAYVADYAKEDFDPKATLSDTELPNKQATLQQQAAKEKLAPLVGSIQISSFVTEQVEPLLKKTITTAALPDLAGQDDKHNWLKQGLDYHTNPDRDTCLFCSQKIPEGRLSDLALMFNDAFEALQLEIDQAQTTLSGLERTAQQYTATLPDQARLTQELLQQYATARKGLAGHLLALSARLRPVDTLLASKAKTPGREIDTTSLPSTEELEGWDTTFHQHVSTLNALIEQHNKLHDDFEATKKAAQLALHAHFLALHYDEYLKLKAAFDQAKSHHSIVTEKIRSKQLEIDDLTKSMREHGPPAGLITSLVQQFLGHKEISLVATETGYRIERANSEQLGALSEGEKTAITICYFLILLEGEGRAMKDLIVVVDDPISSLDSKALNYAFSLFKAALKDAGQLFILTHNLHFMNECKKWLKSKTEDAVNKANKTRKTPLSPSSALFFIEARQRDPAQRRQAKLITLPTLLREYESEYHYLYSVVHHCASAGQPVTTFHYLMPNAMRKLLDVYLAFKLPGVSAFSDQLSNEFLTESGLDKTRLASLERLVQVESHANSLDDLTNLPDMTVEEAQLSAQSIMELIERTDQTHFDHMKKLCLKNPVEA